MTPSPVFPLGSVQSHRRNFALRNGSGIEPNVKFWEPDQEISLPSSDEIRTRVSANLADMAPGVPRSYLLSSELALLSRFLGLPEGGSSPPPHSEEQDGSDSPQSGDEN